MPDWLNQKMAKRWWHKLQLSNRPNRVTRNSTTSFLTAATLVYAIGAGITAAAGTRLALQLFLVKCFKLFSLQSRKPLGPELLFLVTTSLSQDWVIYAPAAFLGCGSRLSGSLSGINPSTPVTRYRHGSPIHYRPSDRAETWMIHRRYKTMRSDKLLWVT